MTNTLPAKDPASAYVLVAGGAGFIGSHAVMELPEHDATNPYGCGNAA